MKERWSKVIFGIGIAGALGAGITLAPHHIGPAYLYPDATLTPGLVATQDVAVLTASYTGQTYSMAHRNTTQAQKTQACNEYPDNCKAQHEIDHFCPLALGCADDIKNLWAQPTVNMWQGVNYGFHEKDRLETLLVNKMKAGVITPVDAQNCILKDWVACYQKYGLNKGTFGGVDSLFDPDGDEVE